MRPEPQKVYVVLAQTEFEGPFDIHGIYAEYFDACDARRDVVKASGYRAHIEEWIVQEE